MDDAFEMQAFMGRVYLLTERDAVAHALGCQNCGLREEALFDLALLGWTEEAFIEEAYGWDPEHA
jgi:hypothetical protein